MGEIKQKARVSVRNLVEFILRHGDLDNALAYSDPDAMQEGTRLHKKIQKSMGSSYAAEVPLSMVSNIEYDGELFEITVEGRADGVISNENGIIIDEIKCMYMDLKQLKEMRLLHRAQAMCYASQYAIQYEHDKIGIQLTYCNIETENIKRFTEQFTKKELKEWYQGLLKEYAKWVSWQYHWSLKRDAAMKKLTFPFDYRPGQKELAAGVYRTILRGKKVFIEAPTGVGKTISTLFPAVKAFGEGLVSKIFYLTAKTITRTVAENAFQIMKEQGLAMKLVTLTAKEKSCILEKPECTPGRCERAKGHFDRVNDAVYDLLVHEEGITRELILEYAKKHQVCPFEMCLDVTTWTDGVICDYNYVFDPNVYLRRFFTGDKKQDFVFLIDEAHNLVERAREMYSAALYKEDFLTVKRLIGSKSVKMAKCLDACNSVMLKLKRECDEIEVWENAGEMPLYVMRLISEYEEFLQEHRDFDKREEVLNLYFELKHFINIHDIMDDNYLVYSDYAENGTFRLTLKCMDPSKNLAECLKKGRSAVFFSATLLPIRYYKEQLGGTEEDYAVYAPSPFQQEKRLLLIGSDVSTKYTRRGEEEYERILQYIEIIIKAKKGNYMVFFPSYQMMQQVYERSENRIPNIIMQSNSMTEQEREEFLEAFQESPKESVVGYCVMGGIFSEGIDLKGSRLIGAVIVGTGLPMVCNERELSRGFFDKRNGSGFDYAYLYNGMNKVQQSAGRVIRTVEDKGVVALLDERFLKEQYQELFPREWFPYEVVRLQNVKEKLKLFWNKEE